MEERKINDAKNSQFVLLEKYHTRERDKFPIYFGEQKTLVQALQKQYEGQDILAAKKAFEAAKFSVVLRRKGEKTGLPWFFPKQVTLYYEKRSSHHQNIFVNAHYF
jgi:hypothetical protein